VWEERRTSFEFRRFGVGVPLGFDGEVGGEGVDDDDDFLPPSSISGLQQS